MKLETTIYGPEFTTENGNTDRAKYTVCFNEDTQTFSACATYYNGGGQCLDTLMEIYKEQNIAFPHTGVIIMKTSESEVATYDH